MDRGNGYRIDDHEVKGQLPEKRMETLSGRKIKIVLRLPDGRIITTNRDLPKLPLDV